MKRLAFDISGLPRQKKNQPQVGYVGKRCKLCNRGQPRVFPEPKYRKWERAAIVELQQQWLALPQEERREPLGSADQPLKVEASIRLGPRQRPDLSNLLEAIGDVLEKARIISSDYWIESWGDSRRVYCRRDFPGVHIRITTGRWPATRNAGGLPEWR